MVVRARAPATADWSAGPTGRSAGGLAVGGPWSRLDSLGRDHIPWRRDGDHPEPAGVYPGHTRPIPVVPESHVPGACSRVSRHRARDELGVDAAVPSARDG